MAKKTFIVAHPKLMLSVNGKLEQMELGAPVSMEAKNAASLVKQGKLLAQGSKEAVDVGEKKLTAAQLKKAEEDKAEAEAKAKADAEAKKT